MAGNQYSEDWTLDKCKEFMDEAVAISLTDDMDFIGEVAKKHGTYRDVYDYITSKFPELKKLKSQIKNNCETNCFSNGKNGDIVPSLAIMNLKSNHGWTDRVDNTSKGNELGSEKVTINFKKKK
jgi:hypothetical protein